MKLKGKEWSLICSKYLQSFESNHLTLHSEKLPECEQGEILNELNELISSPKYLTSILIQGGSLDQLVITQAKVDPFEGKLIKIHCLFNSQISQLFAKNIIDSIFSFYGNFSNRIAIDINTDQLEIIDILEKQGFKQSASRLIGDIEHSLNSLNCMNLSLEKGFEFRAPNLSELDEIIRIELDVHKSEPSSVLNQNTHLCLESNIKKFCKKLILNNNIQCLYYDNNIVGFIGFGVKKQQLGYIANVAVLKSFQGRGLSYSLYQRALETLKNQGMNKYYGFSNTGKTLKSANKIGRVVYNRQYEMKKGLT